jgi:hypothetical protein
VKRAWSAKFKLILKWIKQNQRQGTKPRQLRYIKVRETIFRGRARPRLTPKRRTLLSLASGSLRRRQDFGAKLSGNGQTRLKTGPYNVDCGALAAGDCFNIAAQLLRQRTYQSGAKSARLFLRARRYAVAIV